MYVWNMEYKQPSGNMVPKTKVTKRIVPISTYIRICCLSLYITLYYIRSKRFVIPNICVCVLYSLMAFLFPLNDLYHWLTIIVIYNLLQSKIIFISYKVFSASMFLLYEIVFDLSLFHFILTYFISSLNEAQWLNEINIDFNGNKIIDENLFVFPHNNNNNNKRSILITKQHIYVHKLYKHNSISVSVFCTLKRLKVSKTKQTNILPNYPVIKKAKEYLKLFSLCISYKHTYRIAQDT